MPGETRLDLSGRGWSFHCVACDIAFTVEWSYDMRCPLCGTHHSKLEQVAIEPEDEYRENSRFEDDQ